MVFILKPLRCPHCNQPMDKSLLRRKGLLTDFLKRKPFPCPHCQKPVLLPERADTVVSIGIFIAVILAPVFHYWEVNLVDSGILFALGAGIGLVGLWTQKLVKG